MKHLGHDLMAHRAVMLEEELASEPYSLVEISGILASAFISSLLNLNRSERARVLDAHFTGIAEIRDELMAVPDPPPEALEALRNKGKRQ